VTANTSHSPPFRYRSTNGRALLLHIHHRQQKQNPLRRRDRRPAPPRLPAQAEDPSRIHGTIQLQRLVWFESFSEVSAAIQREKEIKGWTRAKKIMLVQSSNQTWEDLSEQWYPQLDTQRV
jgi:hypothetical protein